jgi:1,4-alpha-glucan branching enzyme
MKGAAPLKTARDENKTLKNIFMETLENHSNSSVYSAKNSVKPINFYCAAPDAHAVELAGDFNHWHPLPMKRLLDGWWFARLDLCHGHHLYRFIVDGKTKLDPAAMGVGRDDQNERASLIAVS